MGELRLVIHLPEVMEALDRLEALMSEQSSTQQAMAGFLSELTAMVGRVDEDVRHFQDLIDQAAATDAANKAEIDRLHREADETALRITEATARIRDIDPNKEFPSLPPQGETKPVDPDAPHVENPIANAGGNVNPDEPGQQPPGATQLPAPDTPVQPDVGSGGGGGAEPDGDSGTHVPGVGGDVGREL